VGRLRFTTETAELADCDLVIEAVLERMDLKRTVFARLDEVVPASAVLATNTSSLSVTEIAAGTKDPSRVVGMHFFNPAPVQRLVEVISTVVTAPDVVDDVAELARALGKNAVQVTDRAGFIANALLFGYLNDAIAMVEQHHASREEIDTAMRIAWGYPMGPLALLDLIGLDTAQQILTTMYDETRSRRHAPAPLLKQLVTAGLLGRKSGSGFYRYGEPAAAAPPTSAATTDLGPTVVVGSGPEAERVRRAFGIEADEPSESTAPGLLIDASTGSVDEVRASLAAWSGRTDSAGAVLATTIRSAAVIEVAGAAGRPGDVVGIRVHGAEAGPFVVEIARTAATDQRTVDLARAACRSAGIESVVCRDRAGYVVDALVAPYVNDAVRMLESGYAAADDIDTAMKQGCALPKGPFEMLDVLGATTVLADLERIYDETREPAVAPAPLLRHRIAGG